MPQTHLAHASQINTKSQRVVQDFNASFAALRNFQKVFKKETSQSEFLQAPRSDFFINSIDEKVKAQKTYGGDFGWSSLFYNTWALKTGLSCLESEFKHSKQNGAVTTKSTAFSPTLAYLGDQSYVSLMLLGGASFYEQSRDIKVSSLNRTAESHYHSLDLMAQVGAGYEWCFNDQLSINADVALSSQSVYISGYREVGAQSLNLNVHAQKLDSIQPMMKISANHQLFLGNSALKGSFYLEGSSNVHLHDAQLKAHLSYADPKEAFVTSMKLKNDSQLTMGFNLMFKRSQNFECSAKLKHQLKQESQAELQANWAF